MVKQHALPKGSASLQTTMSGFLNDIRSNGTFTKRTQSNDGKLQKIDETEADNKDNSVKTVTTHEDVESKANRVTYQAAADHARPPATGYDPNELVEDFPMSDLLGDSSATRAKRVKKKSSSIATETMKALRFKMLKVPQSDAKEFSSPQNLNSAHFNDQGKAQDLKSKQQTDELEATKPSGAYDQLLPPVAHTQSLSSPVNSKLLHETTTESPPTPKHEPTTGISNMDTLQKSTMPIQDALSANPQPSNQGFVTAATVLTEHITHGIGNEISLERLKFETPIIFQEEVNDPAIHTRVLVILGRLVNEDPSRKVVSFKESDEKYWKPLEKNHDLPQSMEGMRKYIADPQYNPKTKRLIFHVRFATAKPLRLMKRNPHFMEWLKQVKNLAHCQPDNDRRSNNRRVGFFIGKSCHITNLAGLVPLFCQSTPLKHADSCTGFSNHTRWHWGP